MSENYFHRMWTLTSYRRLKNIIVVMGATALRTRVLARSLTRLPRAEWIPDVRALKDCTPFQLEDAQPPALTQGALARNAFTARAAR